MGNDVVIGSMTLRAPDLLAVGDNVSIGNAVNFENARVERGRLLLGQITLDDDAFVSSYAILEGNTRVGAHGHLEGQSALPDGDVVPADRVWKRLAGARHWCLRSIGTAAAPAHQPAAPAQAKRCSSCFGMLLVAMLFFMPVFPSFVLIDWFDERGALPWLQGARPSTASWCATSCWPSPPAPC